MVDALHQGIDRAKFLHGGPGQAGGGDVHEAQGRRRPGTLWGVVRTAVHESVMLHCKAPPLARAGQTQELQTAQQERSRARRAMLAEGEHTDKEGMRLLLQKVEQLDFVCARFEAVQQAPPRAAGKEEKYSGG